MSQQFFVKQLLLSDMENFTYIIGDKAAGEAFVIDPSGPMKAVEAALKDNGLAMKGILLTHGHYDHVVGVDKVDVPVYLSKDEAIFYTPRAKKLIRTADGEKLKLGAFDVACLHTPGHTPGCQCFLVEGHLFTGDVLFVDAVGRTDLPGGSARVLFNSLQRIKKLPDETVVWPGHHYGQATHAPLGQLKQTNPFLLCDDVDELIADLG